MKKIVVLLLCSLTPLSNYAESIEGTETKPQAQVTHSCTFHKINKILLPGAFIGASFWGAYGANKYYSEERDFLSALRNVGWSSIHEGTLGFAMGYFWPVTLPLYAYHLLLHKKLIK